MMPELSGFYPRDRAANASSGSSPGWSLRLAADEENSTCVDSSCSLAQTRAENDSSPANSSPCRLTRLRMASPPDSSLASLRPIHQASGLTCGDQQPAAVPLVTPCACRFLG
ncbi:hypothetical protein BO78DRAFT_72104 [Aspergillus sclerotiicarbonarius CBS 121057]|uniref:Uncharacterized protein n=1 Tax=Aspergillus sclerotiicarbonarius (strain CBS 121057 / IBT 28362) TaxID=1448318 RepID=A0A319F0E2_ASPSB|nr:hypothetical protein BO78DRAFT_72104 [Aspergillus sclerotiicarbonarius CBS 121057]